MKKILTFIIAITVFSNLFSTATFAQLKAKDLEGHWAKDVIEKWMTLGMAGGYPDGTFKPDNGITRAEFMVLINRAFGYSKSGAMTFNDVKTEDWFFEAVSVAHRAGYISGFEDGSMRPNSLITRQEVALILFRIMKIEANVGRAERFTDAEQIGEWSKGAVGAISNLGFMSGYPNGSFGPKNHIKRGEAVVAINNVMMKSDEKVAHTVVAKQDFLGITYIHVTLNANTSASTVRANGIPLIFDKVDGKWKGTSLTLNVGDEVHIEVTSGGTVHKQKTVVEEL